MLSHHEKEGLVIRRGLLFYRNEHLEQSIRRVYSDFPARLDEPLLKVVRVFFLKIEYLGFPFMKLLSFLNY